MKKIQFTPKYLACNYDQMHACCGITVAYDLFVKEDADYDENENYYEEDDFSRTFTQKTKDLWKKHWADCCQQERVRQLLATTTEDMTLFRILFKRTGWEALTVTKNPKTNATITLWSYQL